MTKTIITGLLWFSAIGCGLIGGLYFAFSAVIMTSLGRIDQGAGIVAMNAINEDIVRSSFMPIFLGTTLAGAALAAMAVFGLGGPESSAMLAGGVIYVIGMFVVTMIFNVPLNNALAAIDPAGLDSGLIWTGYVSNWAFWNHVRMFASVIASALFVWAIAVK
jgi:uncharacterized membrane protein